MMDGFLYFDAVTDLLGRIAILGPTLLAFALGATSLAGRPMSERAVSRCTQAAVVSGLLAVLGILAAMLATGTRFVPLEFGNWVSLEEHHFHFHFKFVFDRLSIPFCILSFILCGIVGAFSSRYLHREPGFNRFFVFYALFLLGMVVSSLAGTIETLFLGWELVGVSSALLVAYFHERVAPVANGLRVWSVYRIADAAFLIAALLLHHYSGAGDFEKMTGGAEWPAGAAALAPEQALVVGLLLLVAAAGKSALVPFSGWLPRAMEGPTPSSAIFYGALSVHLGAYLLLRMSPVIERSFLLSAIVVGVGLVTAAHAAITARVQTDIKSALVYASLTQVGIIVMEIGLGLRYVALVHIIGHACLRTLQLLRAPTLLHDYHTIENAIGGRRSSAGGNSALPGSPGFRSTLYRWGLERGYLDNFLDLLVVRPFLTVFRLFDRIERRWTDLLSGGRSRASDEVEIHSEVVEEIRR
ncbi:MAG: NADH-quinone oxidoreductase subunit L [Candidatus Binatia bacterium]|jgi:NADH-quinone oxidoreductase subunit L